MAIDNSFLPDLANFVQEDDGFEWSSDVNIPHTIGQGFNYESVEDDECSWFIDTSFFDENVPQESPRWIGPAGQPEQSSSRASTESEDPNKHATVNIMHDISTLANSTPSALPLFSEAEDHDTPHSISLESQPSEMSSSPTFPKEATKDIEIIDLTWDDLHASPEPSNLESAGHSSNGIVVKQRVVFVDLTQDDDDDKEEEEEIENWYDGNCDNIDYDYRSCYENKIRSMTLMIGSSHSKKPRNFSVTEILHNGKTYRWNHRCKRYKNGDSYATPNHKDTAIVIRDGGSDIPINLTYKGSGIWEGSNYRIGVVITDNMAKNMVFRRQSLPLKRKRGCMYSDDLSPRKRERNGKACSR